MVWTEIFLKAEKKLRFETKTDTFGHGLSELKLL